MPTTAAMPRPANPAADRTQPLISMRRITKSFGSVQAFRGASVEAHAGEIVALVGDNGAGKSTLVKVMAGVFGFDSGDHDFEGRPANIRTPSDATAMGIQTVYQDLALCNNLDAVQNLFLGRELTGSRWWGRRIRRAECEVRAREVLTRMRLGNLSLTRPVGAMSGGQRQNIAIARSILWTPKVVILDEPTAALSHSAAEQVSRLVRTLADQGLGVVIVSHDIHHFVVNATDRVEVMRLGANAASFRSRDVTGEQVVNARVGGNEAVNLAG
ncbi:ATP-binding cassette domain-containing protein [Rubellimicrobium aerolatum]|uniref:ATP-binding cassette domain-containing protein n=1 Tax=Rubellimicrobium aerolatum TaxID=490979 RepID=A0ABW0SD64_9RHOB|nr:ATP-binding cassette domain-containing protein [Rubellimicrobium aerolatum]MBP1806663.1 simple sugar transport system ATP-binding protein/D-xylose transport system ATP-binding protein [Rubellimicrobium aerolatum]